MAMEVNHKLLYKLELLLVKLIPVLVSAFYVLNAILSYFNFDNVFVSISVQVLFLSFLYVSSYIFKFCFYHRLFIYYIILHELLAWYDYLYDIPISDKSYLVLQLIIVGVFIFMIAYFHNKNVRKNKKTISETLATTSG